MLTSSIPILLVAAFLLLSLVASFISRKATTFREYAVDNKRVSTFKLVLTAVATNFDGIALIDLISVFHDCFDLLNISFLFFIPLIFWFISLLWVRMAPFMKHLSIIETIGYAYGKYFRFFAGLCAIVFSIYGIYYQVIAISFVIRILVDAMNHKMLTIGVTLVVVVYAALGGIRSITNTDVLQGIVFISIILLIARIMFLKTGQSTVEIISLLHKREKFGLNSLFHSDMRKWVFFLSFIRFTFWIYDPVLLQRAYMCSTPSQIKKVFLYSSWVACFIAFFLGVIAISVFVVNPTLGPIEIWQYIVADMPSFLRSLVVVCVLGMAISTADSYLHFCSVVVGHDLVEIIRGERPVSDRMHIQVSKWTVGMIGLFVMIVAYHWDDLVLDFRYDIIYDKISFYIFYIMFSFQFALAPCFILALFGFRSSSYTAFIGIGIFILFFFVSIKLGCGLFTIPRTISAVASMLSMLVAHYLLPQPANKGWVGLDPQQKRILQLTRLFRRLKS